MEEIATLGLDIAKSVFQVHAVDKTGAVVVRRRLTRARLLPFFTKLRPCLIGIEACATAHHWARELHGLGHEVRLMPPAYVKPYVKRQKNDAADAEAICEAVTRPSMRFVEVKTLEQQSVLVLHRTRQVLIRQRTQISNAIRGHMGEFGLVAPIGRNGLQTLIDIIRDEADDRLSPAARSCLTMLADQLRLVSVQILEADRQIMASARASEISRRLMSIPGVGPLCRTAQLEAALAATADGEATHQSRSGSFSRTKWPGWCGQS
jgi:transposase